MLEQSTNTQSAEPTPGRQLVGDKVHLIDARGALVPIEVIKARDLIIDQETRSLVAGAQALSAQIAAFRREAMNSIQALQELLLQDYGAKAGGKKGNITLTSYDGLLQVKVRIQDVFTYGPELQVAKTLVDECLTDWTADSSPKIRALINDAFRVDKEGQVSRSALLALLRLEIESEPRWDRAMDAIRDAERATSSREYILFYRRPSTKAAWAQVPLDVAAL